MIEFIPFLFLGIPFALFALLTVARKKRLRSLAESLGGRQMDVGWFSLGRIIGESFEIAPLKVGKSYRTDVRIVSKTPGTFLLDPRFFEGFPDWDFAKVPACRTERAFFWHVTLPGYAPPSAEQRQSLLGWLPRTLEARRFCNELGEAGIRAIEVAEGSVSTSLRGLVLNRSRLHRALEVLDELSGRRRSA